MLGKLLHSPASSALICKTGVILFALSTQYTHWKSALFILQNGLSPEDGIMSKERILSWVAWGISYKQLEYCKICK